MRVSVDLDRCEGHAVCMGIAPDVFVVDDEEYARVLVPEPASDRHEAVRDAALRCPKQAISVEE